MICSDYVTGYERDSFDGYMAGLLRILTIISNEIEYDEMEIYLDDIKFRKTDDFLQAIREHFPKVKKCSTKQSRNNRAIQLADLVV